MTQLSDKLTQTIKDENFQDVMVNLGETSLDNLIEGGLLKDIPLLGTIVGLTRTTLTIQDKLFTKKVITFLFQLKNTTNESRKKQIDKIERDSQYKTKVGEKLLYIIDKCEDNEKASYIGKLFQCFIEEKIEYDGFLRASRCVELTFLLDLKRFIKEKWDNMDMEVGGDLVGSGLMDVIYTPGDGTWGNLGKGGTLRLYASSIGKKIQELLDE